MSKYKVVKRGANYVAIAVDTDAQKEVRKLLKDMAGRGGFYYSDQLAEELAIAENHPKSEELRSSLLIGDWLLEGTITIGSHFDANHNGEKIPYLSSQELGDIANRIKALCGFCRTKR